MGHFDSPRRRRNGTHAWSARARVRRSARRQHECGSPTFKRVPAAAGSAIVGYFSRSGAPARTASTRSRRRARARRHELRALRSGLLPSRRSVRPARGVQKSNRHASAGECPPGAAKDVHLTVERGRRRASCVASRRFWRRAAARRHAHQHSLGNAAASERLSDQIALVGGARRSCARRRRLLAARRRARHSIASRPILLASFVLAFSLALAGRSAKSNGCSHGGPRLSQTRLARSVPAARRSGAESTILRIGDADWRSGGLENAISPISISKIAFFARSERIY